MKKKILFGLGALAVVSMFTFNVSLVHGTLQLPKAAADVKPTKNDKQLYSNGTLFCCKPNKDYDCQSADCD